MKYILILGILAIALMNNCYYDSEEDLYPQLSESCDTMNVTFNNQIVSLLSLNCLACHSNSNAATQANNITLEDYEDVVSLQENMLGAIMHDPLYPPMPKNGGMLNDCLITQFELWIENGSPQN